MGVKICDRACKNQSSECKLHLSPSYVTMNISSSKKYQHSVAKCLKDSPLNACVIKLCAVITNGSKVIAMKGQNLKNRTNFMPLIFAGPVLMFPIFILYHA